MARRRQRPSRRRYRIHFHELGYYQCIVDASTPQKALAQFERSSPVLTFFGSEDRQVIGIDELSDDRTWRMLSDTDAGLPEPAVSQSQNQTSVLADEYALYVITTSNVQAIAEHILGRKLTAEELAIVEHKMEFDVAEEIEQIIDGYIR